MKGKTRWITAALATGAVFLGLLAPMAAGTAAAEEDYRRGPGGWNLEAGQRMWNVPAGTLDDAEKTILEEAILEEYGALNLYSAVLDQFPGAYPFSFIVRSEQQHVNALSRVATKYGVAVPANPGLSPAPKFEDLQAACAAGVAAEKADAALYDELKPQTDNAALLRVFNNLQSASLNNHLPAFEACD